MTSNSPTVGVVAFDAATDARHTAVAFQLAGASTVMIDPQVTQLPDVDAVVLPGGFSSGDYVRPGILSAIAPVMTAVAEAAQAGTPVLGIGNGFQVLTEAGLLPGAFISNDSVKYSHDEVDVVVNHSSTAFTADYQQGETLCLVQKAAFGQYMLGEDELAELRKNGQIVAEYAGTNPSGSVANIAAVTNERGTVVGMMVHPEYAIEEGFGTDSADGPGMGVDGRGVFTSLTTFLAGGAAQNSATEGAR